MPSRASRRKPVWQHFYELTQIPRPSHREEKVSAFVADFGRGLGLETEVDEVGNVLIRKPATAGMEDRRGVVLQAHMDMVGVPAEGSEHDFETDSIRRLCRRWLGAGRGHHARR